MKHFYLIFVVCAMFFFGGCAGNSIFGSKNNIYFESSLALSTGTDIQLLEPSGLTASFQDDNIAIIESDGAIVNKIPIPFDENQAFLSMADDDNGYLLYCSTPAMGQMMKSLYVTEDRWATYDEKDISSLIDGYPTSLCALSTEHIYIGTQMRSDGYLFEATDGGEHWTPVSVDNGYFKYCYVPKLDENDGIVYALLEYEDSGKDGNYNLYQYNAQQSTWVKVGYFSLDGLEVQEFFMIEGYLYIVDSHNQKYQITL